MLLGLLVQISADSLLQAKLHHAVVSQLPQPSPGIPPAARGLHRVAQLHLLPIDPKSDDRIDPVLRASRLPIDFVNDQLHRLEPLPALLVIPLPDEEQTLPVLGTQPLRADYTPFESSWPTRLHHRITVITAPRALKEHPAGS